MGSSTDVLRKVVLFPPKEEGLIHAWRSQQPGSSTKHTSLLLSSCCSLLFAASVCHSASHPLSILSFLALYTATLSRLDSVSIPPSFHLPICLSTCMCPAFVLQRARQRQGCLLIIIGLIRYWLETAWFTALSLQLLGTVRWGWGDRWHAN